MEYATGEEQGAAMVALCLNKLESSDFFFPPGVGRETIMKECYECVHARQLTGDAHICCTSFDDQMTGDAHGIKMGWFNYPANFDPTWKKKKCEF